MLKTVLLQHGQAVDDGGAVAVQHALRIARGARGIAERGGRALVQLGPVVAVRLAGEQALLGNHLEAAAQRAVGRDIGLRPHDDDGAQAGRQPVGQRLGARQQGRVDEQVGVGGILQDEGDLVGEEPRIHRMQHGAHRGDAVVDLQVPVLVPGQRGDALAAAAPRGRPAHGPAGRRGRRPAARYGATRRAIRPGGDDLRPAMVPRRVLEHGGDQQRTVLHQAEHGSKPPWFALDMRRRGRRRQGSAGREAVRRG